MNLSYTSSAQYFIEKVSSVFGENEAKSICRIVFEDVFGITNLTKKGAFTPAQFSDLDNIIQRLLKAEPIQYILGEADFYGLKLKVTPDVLIPRQETEELVHWILQTTKGKALKILDIGTGSGCIPITLKKNAPSNDVFALDISRDALAIAQENAARYSLAINFLTQDIRKKSNWVSLPNFDIIISNPPYIPREEAHLMPSWVTEYEPDLALFVEEKSPLFFYDVISSFALEKMKFNGFLFFEVNENLGLEVVDLLEKKGFQNIILQKDLNDKNRMLRAKRLSS